MKKVIPIALLLLLAATCANAGVISKTVPFKLDSWYDLDATDGPVTIHRLMIEKLNEPVGKSKFFRPGNSEFLRDVRIVIEYSNDSKNDWEADLDIVWLDAQGREIDGYNDDESLNEDEHREDATVTLSTLRYGLDRAAKLRIKIHYERD